MASEFPRRLIREETHDWNIVGNTAGAGQTATSSVDVRSDGGGLWMASFNTVRIGNDVDTKLWRAVRQICNGGVTPIIVPRNDILFVPWPDGLAGGYDGVTHDDGALFDDDSGYYQSIIDVTARGNSLLRATTMEFDIEYCGPLQGGESFSIEHPTFGWRLYEIGTVETDGVTATVTFNPPLREAVEDGERIEFDRPRCLMKLATPGAMDIQITALPFNAPSVKFIESKYAVAA